MQLQRACVAVIGRYSWLCRDTSAAASLGLRSDPFAALSTLGAELARTLQRLFALFSVRVVCWQLALAGAASDTICQLVIPLLLLVAAELCALLLALLFVNAAFVCMGLLAWDRRCGPLAALDYVLWTLCCGAWFVCIVVRAWASRQVFPLVATVYLCPDSPCGYTYGVLLLLDLRSSVFHCLVWCAASWSGCSRFLFRVRSCCVLRSPVFVCSA